MLIAATVFGGESKGVTVVLNESDAKKLTELTHKFQGEHSVAKSPKNPSWARSDLARTSPPKDGIIEFSGYSGNIAEYLRRRFGK
jgi:hypothetical protein